MKSRVIEDVANVSPSEREVSFFVHAMQDVHSQNTLYGDLDMRLRRILQEILFWSNFSYLIHIRKRKASKIYNVLKVMGSLQRCHYGWCRFSLQNLTCSNPLYYESRLFVLEKDSRLEIIYGCSLSPEWKKFEGTLYLDKSQREEIWKWKKDGRLWQRR